MIHQYYCTIFSWHTCRSLQEFTVNNSHTAAVLVVVTAFTHMQKVYNKKGAIKFSQSNTVLVVVSCYCWDSRNIEPAFVRRVDPPATPHQYCCPSPLNATFFVCKIVQ
jgi:hypothetical protein